MRYFCAIQLITNSMTPLACLRAALLLAFCILAPARALCQDVPVLRLMTYNVHNAKGLDGRIDTRRIATVIADAAPDIVAIQEIDSATGRSDGRYLLAEIAAAAGMRHVFAPAIDYDGGKYGIGILCKEQPLRQLQVALPGREERRALLAVEMPGYVFACTHLSLTEQDRLASLAIIDSVAALTDKPFYIAGDFNAQPGDAFMTQFTDRFHILSTQDEPSFPADAPDILLDYIAIKKRAPLPTVTSTRVIPDPQASDHRPVTARLTPL